MCWAVVGKNKDSAYSGWLLFIYSDKNRSSLHLSRCPPAGKAEGAGALSCLSGQIPLHLGSCPNKPHSPVTLTARCAHGAGAGSLVPKPRTVLGTLMRLQWASKTDLPLSLPGPSLPSHQVRFSQAHWPFSKPHPSHICCSGSKK